MSQCIQWQGKYFANGYGRIGYKMAHRIAYTEQVGEIPEGLQIDHLCRNRGCVNVEHLEPVTIAVNVMRGVSPHALNARKTHCLNGHEFTEENTYRRKDKNTRDCRTCRNAAVKKSLRRRIIN